DRPGVSPEVMAENTYITTSYNNTLRLFSAAPVQVSYVIVRAQFSGQMTDILLKKRILDSEGLPAPQTGPVPGSWQRRQ
ncbi:MAG: hypothetical protein OEU51_04345, partial [Gammaproteobacteria bacterium]|nr:hypothetical protein [Gammaproteobacteria bacterium]